MRFGSYSKQIVLFLKCDSLYCIHKSIKVKCKVYISSLLTSCCQMALQLHAQKIKLMKKSTKDYSSLTNLLGVSTKVRQSQTNSKEPFLKHKSEAVYCSHGSRMALILKLAYSILTDRTRATLKDEITHHFFPLHFQF